jgi:hypothetical protein
MQYTPKEKPGARNKKTEGKSNPKLRYAAITSNNSLTRVALLVEILHICSNNKLKQVTTPSDKPPTGGRKTETPFMKSHRQPQKKGKSICGLPVVRARIIPARRPLKSRNTSSTVRGLYPGSIRSGGLPDSGAAGGDLLPFLFGVFLGGVFFERRRFKRGDGRNRERGGREAWECDFK